MLICQSSGGKSVGERLISCPKVLEKFVMFAWYGIGRKVVEKGL